MNLLGFIKTDNEKRAIISLGTTKYLGEGFGDVLVNQVFESDGSYNGEWRYINASGNRWLNYNSGGFYQIWTGPNETGTVLYGLSEGGPETIEAYTALNGTAPGGVIGFFFF